MHHTSSELNVHSKCLRMNAYRNVNDNNEKSHISLCTSNGVVGSHQSHRYANIVGLKWNLSTFAGECGRLKCTVCTTMHACVLQSIDYCIKWRTINIFSLKNWTSKYVYCVLCMVRDVINRSMVFYSTKFRGCSMDSILKSN